MGLFNRVYRGQKVRRSADTENAMRDAAEEFSMGRGGASHNIDLQPRPTDIVKIRNSTGDALPRFAVLGMNGPLIGPDDNLVEFKRQVTFDGVTPVGGTHEAMWAILLGPLGDGKIGTAQASGVVPALISYSDANDAWEGFAEIADGETTLAHDPDTGSARILWAEDSGEERWGIIRIGDGPGDDEFSFSVQTANSSLVVDPVHRIKIGANLSLANNSNDTVTIDGIAGGNGSTFQVDGVNANGVGFDVNQFNDSVSNGVHSISIKATEQDLTIVSNVALVCNANGTANLTVTFGNASVVSVNLP